MRQKQQKSTTQKQQQRQHEIWWVVSSFNSCDIGKMCSNNAEYYTAPFGLGTCHYFFCMNYHTTLCWGLWQGECEVVCLVEIFANGRDLPFSLRACMKIDHLNQMVMVYVLVYWWNVHQSYLQSAFILSKTKTRNGHPSREKSTWRIVHKSMCRIQSIAIAWGETCAIALKILCACVCDCPIKISFDSLFSFLLNWTRRLFSKPYVFKRIISF